MLHRLLCKMILPPLRGKVRMGGLNISDPPPQSAPARGEEGRWSRGCMAAWLALSCLTGAFSFTVHAAEKYPTRPVRFVIPFPPGGGNDILGRAFAERLGERLGHGVVVGQRGGG